jgi:hypothetical protein
MRLMRLCISSFTADSQGVCSSIVQSYRMPSEYCVRLVGDGGGGDFVNSTLSIWGTTLTGSAYSFSGTGTITTETETLETRTASMAATASTATAESTETYVAVSVVGMIYLVHEAAETAGGTTSPTPSSTSSGASVIARGPQLASLALIVSTLAMAFISGFSSLVA